jgi:hypothetical protein
MQQASCFTLLACQPATLTTPLFQQMSVTSTQPVTRMPPPNHATAAGTVKQASHTPEVCVDRPAGDTCDVSTAHLALWLRQWLLKNTVAGINLGVSHEARQQVNAVHSRVAGQCLGQLNHILDLQGKSSSGITTAARQARQ